MIVNGVDVREYGAKLLTVEEAVRKMTSMPAELFGMKGRGIIRTGYTADITVTEQDTGRSEDARISVNNPAKRFGWTFYQNSTGYASRVRVLKDGKDLQEEILCVGESLAVADKPDLIIHFQAFYPDYVMADSGPATRSGQMNHPAWLYLVAYQGQVLGMNALMEGEELTIDEYTVLFDQPRN